MIQICINSSLEALNKKKSAMQKYNYIMESVWKVNVATDADFQRIFNSFYKVRRNYIWRNLFYEQFEANKQSFKVIDFETVITGLYQKTGRVESSFSSKLLSSLNSDMPIWDSIVMKNLGLKLSGKTQKEKLKNAIVIYNSINQQYQDYFLTLHAKECIEKFDFAFPEFKSFSAIKKIDFLIWSNKDFDILGHKQVSKKR